MIEHLENELASLLKSARRLSIAVALMKDYGLNVIENNAPASCERRYLLGIDLPTTPSVLRELLNLSTTFGGTVKCKVFRTLQNYHPKVYIIETKDGEVVAFVGSANATNGGLKYNVEMNIRVVDQIECNQLLSWFDTLFISSIELNKTFLDDYETVYRRNKSLALTQKSNIAAIIQNPARPAMLVVNRSQFFRQSDFDAFDPNTHFLTDDNAVSRRGAVRNRLIELAEMIQPHFYDYEIEDLNLPASARNYTSQHFHSRGNNHIPKHAIWLNFGKSVEELDRHREPYKSFVTHARIQIILGNTDTESYIGIWLYFSKPNWSFFDRSHLQKKLSDAIFVQRLYDYCLQLGGAYWITLDDHELAISNLFSPHQLRDFLRHDNYTQEFIIGRNYDPNDSDISEDNIIETTLTEFGKLYKIYDLIRDKR